MDYRHPDARQALDMHVSERARVWPEAPSHSNQALRYWLKPEGLDRKIASEAHRALPDAYVTAFTLRELLKRATFAELVAWSAEPALLPRVTFGKHKGAAWGAVPPDYLDWLLRQADMNEDVKFTARKALKVRPCRTLNERQ